MFIILMEKWAAEINFSTIKKVKSNCSLRMSLAIKKFVELKSFFFSNFLRNELTYEHNEPNVVNRRRLKERMYQNHGSLISNHTKYKNLSYLISQRYITYWAIHKESTTSTRGTEIFILGIWAPIEYIWLSLAFLLSYKTTINRIFYWNI